MRAAETSHVGGFTNTTRLLATRNTSRTTCHHWRELLPFWLTAVAVATPAFVSTIRARLLRLEDTRRTRLQELYQAESLPT